MKTKLIAKLQFAHAAELAAYHAYEGHWRSLSNLEEIKKVREIQQDELSHIRTLRFMIFMLPCVDPGTNEIYDNIGIFVGKCIGLSCFIFGWKLPMKIAGLMERIGTSSYKEIAKVALDAGYLKIYHQLHAMAENEEEHEKYFNNLRKNK